MATLCGLTSRDISLAASVLVAWALPGGSNKAYGSCDLTCLYDLLLHRDIDVFCGSLRIANGIAALVSFFTGSCC